MKLLRCFGIKKYDPFDNEVLSMYIYSYLMVIMISVIFSLISAFNQSDLTLGDQVSLIHSMFYRCFTFLSMVWISQLLTASALSYLGLKTINKIIAYLIIAFAYFGSLIMDVFFNFYFIPTWFITILINHIYLSIMEYLSLN